MKSDNFLNQPRARKWETLLHSVQIPIPKGTTILRTNIVFLGGFFFFLILRPNNSPLMIEEFPSLTPTRTREIADSAQRRPSKTPTPTNTPTPSPTYTPTSSPAPSLTPTQMLPDTSEIGGISGHRQSMPLSCEARSAVDWAAYFGKTIDERVFFNGLPTHDNPDKGFVGDVYGSWGQIPPNPYGVHAKPVAQRLREFGLKAKAVKGMTYQELKAEIASGQPVIVWVVGHVNRGTPIPYTASGGAETIVAKFEHTVIVTGYTEHKITFLDGSKVYTRYKGEFIKSWNVLGNQAVIWID